MTDMALRWWWRKPSPSTSSQDERKREAEAALASTERVKQKASTQVGFFQELRAGWDRVHSRNNLAQLFDEGYGKRPR